MRKPILLSVVAILLLTGIAYAWERTYGGELGESATHVEIASDGGFIIGGWTESFAETEVDFWLLRIDSLGDTLWTATYDGGGDDRCKCLSQTADGGYLLTGYTITGEGENEKTNLMIVKTDSLGSIAVAENPIAKSRTNCLLITSIGQTIVLSYENHPRGFHVGVFDALGRKVDEIHADSPSGVIHWGQHHSPGVYFIKADNGDRTVCKAVLIR